MDGKSDGDATEPRPAVEPPAPALDTTDRKAARREAKRRPLNPDDPDPAWLSRGSGRRTLVGVGLVIAVIAAVAGLGWVWFKPASAFSTGDGQATDEKCRITENRDDDAKVTAPNKLGTAAPRATATVSTNMGEVSVLLFGDVAPCSVSNFAYLTGRDFYKDNTCYRLTTQPTDPTVTLRCGDPSGTGKGGPGYRVSGEDAFTGEVGRDYVALINDHKGRAGGNFAFIRGESKPTDSVSVIGQVIAGHEILDRIGSSAGIEPYDDKPPQPVLIENITIETGTVTIPPTDDSPSGSPTTEGHGDSPNPTGSTSTSPGEESTSSGDDFPS